MSDEPPTPPAELPADLVASLDELGADNLEKTARYTEKLAEYKKRQERLEDREQRPDDRPDGVPSKATITIKEINDNRYYYWQWRDGDTVTSKYKGPVNPDE